MKNIFKKTLMLMLVLVLLVATMPMSQTAAASYPTCSLKKYQLQVKAGTTVDLKYTVYHEYQHEKVLVDIYDPNGEKVATSEQSFSYNYNYTSNYTLSWDTTGYEPGTYEVVAQNMFYSFMGWHSSPTSTTCYVTILPNLAAPKTLTATLQGHNKVKLNWSKVNNADGYFVYYKLSNAKNYTYLGWTSKTTYTKANLGNAKKYNFQVVPCKKTNGKYEKSGNYKTVSIQTIHNLAAPKTVTANLYGHNDIKISWSKVTNAKAYDVYYKTASAKKYTYLGRTPNNTYKKANLNEGVRYYFKIVPCSYANNKCYADDSYKTANTYTLKKVQLTKVKRHNSSKVKVQWKNIAGESGYQVSCSTKKNKTQIVSTFNSTNATSKVISVKKGKTYYYKVRSFKTVNGNKIYGPWSAVKSYKNR